MKSPQIPNNEVARLQELRSYKIVDTIPEADYDDITRIASIICNTPMALVTFIDDDTQYLKSRQGLTAKVTPRELAFCAHAINDPNKLMIVPDARLDDRFLDNPLVTGSPNVIFYAGMPLVTSDGYSLGTLCVIDSKPNELSGEQQDVLKSLAHQVVHLLELRKAALVADADKSETAKYVTTIENQNRKLREIAWIQSHVVRAPLSRMMGLIDLIKNYTLEDIEKNDLLTHLLTSAAELDKLVKNISEKTQKVNSN